MSNENITTRTQILYDRLRVQELTGSYGKAKMVVDTKKDYVERAKLAIELAAVTRAFGSYVAGIISYKKRRHQDGEAIEALTKSANSIKRAFNNLAFQLVKTVNGTNQYLKRAPLLSDAQGISSSSGCATSIAYILRLVARIENGKGDFLTTVAQDIAKVAVEAYELNSAREKDLKVFEISEKFTAWADDIRLPRNPPNFVASQNTETVIKGRMIELLKSGIPTITVSPEEDDIGEGLYVFQKTAFVKDSNGIVTQLY